MTRCVKWYHRQPQAPRRLRLFSASSQICCQCKSKMVAGDSPTSKTSAVHHEEGPPSWKQSLHDDTCTPVRSSVCPSVCCTAAVRCFMSVRTIHNSAIFYYYCYFRFRFSAAYGATENAGLELKGPSSKTGKCRTGIKRTKIAEVENEGRTPTKH